ncbi:MAG TPA: ribose-5-phosphate isomerase RpiA [Thermoplasmata archaeon]|nr:ribose-5-phosphate isomerase RpiA [Thermoplasmata archaeon]HEV2429355.1 ribose-5-phosphate isomerase RpiA [Thermoplasmata archaeon]
MADPLLPAKAAAARAAVAEVEAGQRIALGTGSTAAEAIRALGQRFPDGGRLDCVASSAASEGLARSLGLSVRALEARDRFDLMLDGADEVSEDLDLTKGGGGALFREKLLARRTDRLLILVDPTKLVARLGTRVPIPLEVVPFAREAIVGRLRELGLPAEARRAADGPEAYRTDNGLEILDVRPPVPLEAPAAWDAEVRAIPGVVETGLFVGLAERVYVGTPDGRVTIRGRR